MPNSNETATPEPKQERYEFRAYASAYGVTEAEARAIVERYLDRDEAQHAGISASLDESPAVITTEEDV